MALPDTSGINVNTALLEVLQSLNAPDQMEPITSEDAQSIQGSRPTLVDPNAEFDSLANTGGQNGVQQEEGFESVDDFLNSNDLETVFGVDQELKPSAEGLTTGTNYFILMAEVELDGIKRRSYSLLKRSLDTKTNSIRVRSVRRSSEDLF